MKDRKEPLLALALGFAFPGLGQIYVGKFGRGLLYFFALNLLLAAGLVLSKGAVYLMSGAAPLYPSASKLFLLFLMPIPEILNLGGTLTGAYLLLNQAGVQVPGQLPFEQLGFILTALSGILNLFVMAEAWTLASDGEPPAQRNPAFAALLSWILPGAGHFYLGQRFKAWFFFSIVSLLFLGGMLLGAGLVVSRERFFYYWAGEFLNGGATIVSTILTRSWHLDAPKPFYELGLLYVTVSGLLNVLVMLSAYSSAKEAAEAKA